MKISVVGSGYVGLVAGACLADLGHDVIVVDNDHQKLAALNQCTPGDWIKQQDSIVAVHGSNQNRVELVQRIQRQLQR